MNTKAAGEILVWQCLETLLTVTENYTLSMDVTLVKSCLNCADCLTQVPWVWLDLHRHREEPVPKGCASVGSRLNKNQVTNIHHQSGHPGVKRTLYFARSVALLVFKKLVESVVKACQSIDPAPVHWKKGTLVVKQTWSRLAMDITHYRGGNFHIDCNPLGLQI